jgi:outer membrane lipoprotein SlyB
LFRRVLNHTHATTARLEFELFFSKERNMSVTPIKVSPIVAIAAGSIIVFSAVGVGVMTGLIPSSFSTEQQSEPAQAAVVAPAPAPAAPAAVPAPREARPARAQEAPRRVQESRRRAEDAPQRAERARVAARACANCGTVRSVNVVERAGEGSGLGAIGGAVVGGVLGNQIGDGSGRRVATVAGAAGGAYAGHQVEKHVKTSKTWNVAVRMEDGSTRSFPYASEPGLRAGDTVKVVNGRLEAR